ncbi:MAG TPA: complex I subunit 1 family protein [Candidatus Sulfotelmatobacter sp.]|nr:complex I subunit 1 family protein [Candidatus Sulfotelmatobacter sp.]
MILFDYLIFPGFLFTAVVGLLATWVDRKVTARVQYRVGPPWFQPFADITKLLGKETIVPEGAVKYVFLGAPLAGLAAVTLIAAILFRNQPFVGDLIVVFYLLTLPSLALIVGGSASRNPLSALGASREMKLVLAYELPFILALATVILKARSIMLGDIVAYQTLVGPLIFSLSGLLAFIAALTVAQAKLGAVPFDIAEAEQELAAGPLLEYSGAPLALFRLTRAMLYLVLPVLLIVLFLGGIDAWAPLKYLLVLIVIILVKNTNPRLRIDHALRLFWGPVTALAVIGFVLALFGW